MESLTRYMKEESQTPDLQEREAVPEREYQRVTISGEEKCGVSQWYGEPTLTSSLENFIQHSPPS